MENGQKYYLPSNDYIFKALMMRNPNLLRDFLRCVLPELEADCSELSVANADLLSLGAGEKAIRLDLRVVTMAGEIINIEMQVASEPGLAKRMQVYLARNYGNQLVVGEQYGSAHRAISVWICKFDMFDDVGSVHRFSLYDREHGIAYPDSMMLVILEATKHASAGGALQPWLEFFAANTEEQVMSLAMANKTMEEACGFVQRMNMTPQERALADAYERDLLDKMLLRGAAFEEGRAEGEAKGLRAVASSMLRAGEPRAKIIQFTRLSEQELDSLM